MCDPLLAHPCAMPMLSEADSFVHKQLGDGEAVVHLGNLQILDTDAGLLVEAADDGLRGVHHRQVGRVLEQVSATGLALQDLDTCRPIDAGLPQAILVRQKHCGRSVGHLAAIGHAAIWRVRLVRQKCRIFVRYLCLLQVDLHRMHVRLRVLVAVCISFRDDGAEIVNAEVLEAFRVVLRSPGQEAREREVVDARLPGEVRGPRQEEAAVPGRDRGLLLRAHDERQIAPAAAPERIHGGLHGEATRRACALYAHRGLVEERAVRRGQGAP
mmetsp:Transcript_27917/g.80034  ORF Transcript_27917/g.80034 Transcript_27917/m.80034 type:complete len:270 (+) Transcript_27917:496-1305(+)